MVKHSGLVGFGRIGQEVAKIGFRGWYERVIAADKFNEEAATVHSCPF